MHAFFWTCSRARLRRSRSRAPGEDLYKAGAQAATFYVGFDPTADSLHVLGPHHIPIMAMAHLQRAGHPYRPVRRQHRHDRQSQRQNDIRKMMSRETIGRKRLRHPKQLSRFLDFQ